MEKTTSFVLVAGHIQAQHLTTMSEGWSVDLVTEQVVQLIHEARATS